MVISGGGGGGGGVCRCEGGRGGGTRCRVCGQAVVTAVGHLDRETCTSSLINVSGVLIISGMASSCLK